ncbi:protein FAM, partial [Clarias magur]
MISIDSSKLLIAKVTKIKGSVEPESSGTAFLNPGSSFFISEIKEKQLVRGGKDLHHAARARPRASSRARSSAFRSICGTGVPRDSATCSRRSPQEPSRAEPRALSGDPDSRRAAGNASIIPESLQRADCSRCAYYSEAGTDSPAVAPSSGPRGHVSGNSGDTLDEVLISMSEETRKARGEHAPAFPHPIFTALTLAERKTTPPTWTLPTDQGTGSSAHAALSMRDKATQTPRAWVDERRRGSHKRSASCGSTDQLKEIAKLRQQLQRSKRSSRHRRDKERKSPFNGNHAIIQSQSQMPKTILIPIPISKSTAPRFRNSIEGLNQEIERIIIRDTPERDEVIIPQDVPDGHRAPPPIPQRSSSTRSIDTQTPSGRSLGGNRSNSSSRADSVSPSYLSILNDAMGNSPLNNDDTLNESREKDLGPYSPLPKYASSPKPNNSYMFKREPPEGCEKVKVFEDN